MPNIQRSTADKTGSVIRYAVLVVGAIFFLLPFYLLVRNGLSTESDITSPSWKLFPSSLRWSNISELFDDPGSPMLGNPKGSVTIVEFFDFRCPYCKGMAKDLRDLVQADGNIRLIYKDFPILGPASHFASTPCCPRG